MKLTFLIGSIPVRVHPSFFLMALLLNYSSVDTPLYFAVWVAVVFLGILLHELGHALVGKAFGLVPEIDLHGMGGLTSWPHGKNISNIKQIAISLAGPFTGIAIGLAVDAYRVAHPPSNELLGVFLQDAYFVNFGWGVLNLLPIMPMDGGNALRALLNVLLKGSGERPARIISIGIAGAVGIWALSQHMIFNGMLALMFAYQNVAALRAGPAVDAEKTFRLDLQRAAEALQRDDGQTAARHARLVLAQSNYGPSRAEAARLLMYALLLLAAWGPLMDLMEQAGLQVLTADELAKFESAAAELGRPHEAKRIGELRERRAGGAGLRV